MKKMRYLTELRGVNDLTPAEFRLLVMLWTYADKECRNAFPGVKRLASDAGVVARQIQRQLRSLEEKGYVVATAHGQGGGHYATHYALTLPARGDGERRNRGDGERHPQPVDNSPRGDGERHPQDDLGVTFQDHRGDGERRPTSSRSGSTELRKSVVASRVRAGAPAHARGADQAEPKARRGTRLPADFIPSEKSRKTILTESPTLDLRREHAKFVDHWAAAPGQRGVKLDWDATWRNWMRKAAEQKQPRVNGAHTRRQQETDDLFARAMARAEAADAADETTLPITIRGELA